MNEIAIINKENCGIIHNGTNEQIGQAVNAFICENIFELNRTAMKKNTQDRHNNELLNFSLFLSQVYGYENHGMTEPAEWSGITFGIIETYRRFMLMPSQDVFKYDRHGNIKNVFTEGIGRAVNSVNQSIYIIKSYARKAGQAGYIPAVERENIRDITGYKSSQKSALNKARQEKNITTRASNKKESAVKLNTAQVYSLKTEHDTDTIGKRDRLIFCVLLDFGLRESELISLRRENFDMETKAIHWHRDKTENEGHGLMTPTVFAAAAEWLELLPSDPNTPVFPRVRKGGEIGTEPLSRDGIKFVVKSVGERITGIKNLSPHDLRHSMATRAYLSGVSLIDIQKRLGHSSVLTTERYIDIESLDLSQSFARDF